MTSISELADLLEELTDGLSFCIREGDLLMNDTSVFDRSRNAQQRLRAAASLTPPPPPPSPFPSTPGFSFEERMLLQTAFLLGVMVTREGFNDECLMDHLAPNQLEPDGWGLAQCDNTPRIALELHSLTESEELYRLMQEAIQWLQQHAHSSVLLDLKIKPPEESG
jgi:hypothetical protein